MGKLQKTCIFNRPFLTEKQIKFRLQSASARLTHSIIRFLRRPLDGEFDLSDEKMADSMGLALPKNYSLELA